MTASQQWSAPSTVVTLFLQGPISQSSKDCNKRHQRPNCPHHWYMDRCSHWSLPWKWPAITSVMTGICSQSASPPCRCGTDILHLNMWLSKIIPIIHRHCGRSQRPGEEARRVLCALRRSCLALKQPASQRCWKRNNGKMATPENSLVQGGMVILTNSPWARDLRNSSFKKSDSGAIQLAAREPPTVQPQLSHANRLQSAPRTA